MVSEAACRAARRAPTPTPPLLPSTPFCSPVWQALLRSPAHYVLEALLLAVIAYIVLFKRAYDPSQKCVGATFDGKSAYAHAWARAHARAVAQGALGALR